MVSGLSQNLADFLGTSQEVVKKLLVVVLSGSSSSTALLQDFMKWTEGSVADEIVHKHIRRLEKISMIIGKWNLSGDEIEYIHNHNSDFRDFNWNVIPIAKTVASSFPHFVQWSGLAEYVEARNSISLTEGDVVEVFKGALDPSNAVEVLENLALLLHLQTDEVKLIAEKLGYITRTANQNIVNEALRNGESIKPVLELARLMKQSGRSLAIIEDWVDKGGHSLEAEFPAQNSGSLLQYKTDTVEQIKNAVKARCGDEQWHTVAREFQDKMRLLQRDRLLDFITAPIGVLVEEAGTRYIDVDQDAIYGRLLIDPLMKPCMNSTRLKQAISSVQLFIHRILMGLEGDIPYSAELETNWKWKKNYRVWEAHRKVFLYPENWIEPELRDNKSPFFEEFEGELSQSEIEDKTIEKAFKNYLSKLDEVSNLEIVAYLTDEQGIFHIVGRTREKPNIYYYRQQTAGRIWTPWEKIDVDIESDHLMIVKYQSSLYLFWPLFKEGIRKLGKDNPNDKGNDKKNYLPYYEIRLAWTKHDEGFWSARKQTKESIEFLYDWGYQEIVQNPLSLLKLRAEVEGG